MGENVRLFNVRHVQVLNTRLQIPFVFRTFVVCLFSVYFHVVNTWLVGDSHKPDKGEVFVLHDIG